MRKLEAVPGVDEIPVVRKLTPRGVEIDELIALVQEKLKRGLRLTAEEAFEVLEIAILRDFSGMELDLSRMNFPSLSLDDGVIGRLLMNDTTIQGLFFRDGLRIERGCYERGLTVGGNVAEADMRIGGEWVESEKIVTGYCDRERIRVDGPRIAIGMRVLGDFNERKASYRRGSYEPGMEIGGSWRQVGKKVRGDLVADGSRVRGDLDRTKLRVMRGNLSQEGLRHGGKVDDIGMKVRGKIFGKASPLNG